MINIRAFELNRDFNSVYKLFFDVWFNMPYSNILGAKLCAVNYLISMLMSGTTFFVAEDASNKNNILGFAILDDRQSNHPYKTFKLRLYYKITSFLLKILPQATLDRLVTERFVGNYNKLSKICPIEILQEPELKILIVSPQAQGKGVGRLLVQKVEDTLKKQKAQSFFLKTDSSCNFRFYDHLKMQCCLINRMNFAADITKDDPCFLDMMIYRNPLIKG